MPKVGFKHSEETKRRMSIVRKGRTAWNKGVSHSEKTKRKLSKIHKALGTKPPSSKGRPAWNKGKEWKERRGANHPNWKGDGVGYKSLHEWVRINYGSPTSCEKCRTKNSRIEWSNKTGKYMRDREDWWPLCVSCHRKYDHGRKKGAHVQA